MLVFFNYNSYYIFLANFVSISFLKNGGKIWHKMKTLRFFMIFFYIYLYVVLDYNPQASHGPIVVEIIFFFLVVDLKSYGTLTLRGFKNQKMCNLWKSYTILRFFQLIVHSQLMSISICKQKISK